MLILILHLLELASSLSKSICVDDETSEKCKAFNLESQNSYLIISKSQINEVFKENPSKLNLAIFTDLDEYIQIPNNYIINHLTIISDFRKFALNINDNSMRFNNFTIENSTILIKTFNSESNRTTLQINDLIESQNSLLKADTPHFRLKLSKPCNYNVIKYFDELEIDQKLTKFVLPIINNQIPINIHILSQNKMLLLVLISTSEQTMYIDSNEYTIASSTNEFQFHTSLPIEFHQNTSNDLNIHIKKDFFNNICHSIMPIKALFNEDTSAHISINIYSGNATIQSEGELLSSNYDRTICDSFLINLIFHNESNCILNSSQSIPISIFAQKNLMITLNKQHSLTSGYLFINNGNITIQNQLSEKCVFGCLSILNLTDYYHNSYLLSQIDITQAEFYEQLIHSKMTYSYLVLNDDLTFHPSFLFNGENIIGGKTIASFYIEKYTSLDFKPKTEFFILNNGTLVVPFHLNFNETYESTMKIHRHKYNELSEQGLNRTFDFDNFYDSFKYYYLKYMPVFSNFSRVFSKSYNQFYSHSIQAYENNSQVRIFIERKDTPINAFYRPNMNLPVQCNVTRSTNVELSSSIVSKYFTAKDFKLKGEINFDNCIQYNLNEIPTSAAELFVYVINTDIISSLKNIPFVTIITPMTINTIYNLMRNKNSRNVVVIVLESMKEVLDFKQFETDTNIFILGLSIKDTNEFITFWNTIRKGSNPKKDLQKALKQISPKIPSILPTVKISMLPHQSFYAVGVTIHKSTIICGSITFALCHFTGYAFVSSANLICDLYSISHLLNITEHYGFLNVTLIPNFISSLNNQTTDLLSITKIDFDENGWFFYSKGTLYDNVTKPFTFGLPYMLAENDFSIYSITDQVEFNLVQSKIPPKSINFISGKKLESFIDDEKIPLLSDVVDDSEEIIEIPSQTRLKFSGFWDARKRISDHFSFGFGDSEALIEKVPEFLNISFSGNKNISIDCNQVNRYIEQLQINGSTFITADNGTVLINNLKFVSPAKSNLLHTHKNLVINNLACELHSKSELNNSLVTNIVMNPDSKLNFTSSLFHANSNLRFNFNFDYELPLLIIDNYTNIDSIVISYYRDHYSKYDPEFTQHLNQMKPFLIVNNSSCSNLETDLINEKKIRYESNFTDFLSNQFLNISCNQIDSNSYIFLTLVSIPKLSLIDGIKDKDNGYKDQFSAPSLHIPTPSRTPKENDMTAAIAGGTVGGIAFIGITVFVVYFILSSKKNDDFLLNTEEETNLNIETKPNENLEISL